MGKHILITGATSGIGKAIAMAAAKQHMDISFTGIEKTADIECDALREAGAGDVHYQSVDLSDAHQARQVAEDMIQTKGRLDILVNNAGIQHVNAVEDFPIEAWDKVIAVNLSAAFHMMAACLPVMKQNSYGRIINIASVHGLVASVNKAAYVAAKHGLIGLTKTVALETAGTGVTCNAICPGWVRTPLVEAQIEARAGEKGTSIEDEAFALVSEKQPSGAFVSPDEIAQMVLFLAGPASAQITGSHFVMDGGWTAQ